VSPVNEARGERREVRIEKLVAGGAGLARADAEVILVPRVAVGDRVVVEIDRSRRPARGRVLKVLEASSERVTPPCRFADRCGGCDWMHLAPEAQRRGKLEILSQALPEAIRQTPIEWHVATPLHGRTRARWHARSIASRTVVGYRALSSSTIVEVDGCGALDPRLQAALVDARAIVAGAEGEGEVHAALGVGGRPVLSIEWKGEIAPAAFRESEERVKEGRLAGVEIAIDGASVPATIGDPRPTSLASDGLAISAPPRGFAQASEIGDAVLVSLVVARARCEGKHVLELFAGSGNLTVSLARTAAHVTAIELSRAACEEARRNVSLRQLAGRVKVVEADAEKGAIPHGTEVIVLDPPRTGARGACSRIASSKVRQVIYVSCDPPTLGRDLTTLLAAGFVVRTIDAVDLFPDTSHVESIVVLERAR
jgi:23S rRNA (uracil1939-C5)-methyltransferase